MGYFDGLSFFLLLGGILLGAFAWGHRGRPGPYALAASVLFAGLIIGPHPAQAAYLLAFLALGLVLVKGYARARRVRGRRAADYHLALALALCPLVLAKASPLWHLSLFGFTGVSYLSFRLLSLIIELYDGVVEEVGTGELLAFFLFFLKMVLI